MQNLLESLGYPGLAFLMLIENLFAPIPSELIMPLAGFAASRRSVRAAQPLDSCA